MSDAQFRADNVAASAVKITPLIRANQLASQGEAWTAPDLQAAMLQESRRAFDLALASARAEVAEGLALMKEAGLASKQPGAHRYRCCTVKTTGHSQSAGPKN